MAERRMLRKSICQSRKVNRLSDKATILYTWAQTWTDRDGYVEAEPDFLKYNVVPRRNDISEDDIPLLVEEIVKQGLWDLYETDEGRKVAHVSKFEWAQKGLDQRKEAESVFLNNINKVSSGTVQVQTKYSRKESKVKEIKVKEKNIKENSKRIFEGVKALASQIDKIYKDWNPWEAIQKAINEGYLIEDIEPALKYMSENKANDPWRCFNSIRKKEKNARLVKEREQEWLTKKIEETRDVARLLKGIGKPIKYGKEE